MRSGITSTYVSSSVATVNVRYFVCLDFKPTGSEDAHRRLWSGLGTASFDDFTGTGKSYYGIGALGSITAVSETTDIAAKGIELTLTGVPSDFLYLALSTGSCYRGRTAAVYLGLFDGGTMVQSTILFRGRMDVMTIEEGAETSTITLK